MARSSLKSDTALSTNYAFITIVSIEWHIFTWDNPISSNDIYDVINSVAVLITHKGRVK